MRAAAAAAVVAAAAAVPAAEAGDAALGLAFHRKPAALWKLQTQLGWDPWNPAAPLQSACMLLGAASNGCKSNSARLQLACMLLEAAKEGSLRAAIGCKNKPAHAQRAFNFISSETLRHASFSSMIIHTTHTEWVSNGCVLGTTKVFCCQ